MNYRLFGNSGLRVSEICLGTMGFGTEWGWGADYDTSKKIFDEYAQAGGNFLDTANRYTDGTSEKYVGDFIKYDRDHFVVATKYTLYDKHDLNYCGNHRKNMFRSVNESLKRLQTEYIDLLWLHAWDFTTPVDEIMRGLDDLVRMGKVHYIGISDTPAWIVAQANTIAQLRGWTAFVGLQIEYSLIQRTAERDLLPMAKAFGMTVTPWGALGGGVLSGKYLKQEKGRLKESSPRLQNPRNAEIASVVVDISMQHNVKPIQIALAWILKKHDNIIPIVGASKPGQVTDSIRSLDIELSENDIARLDECSKTDLGFPHEFLNASTTQDVMFGTMQNLLKR
ncbi:MAG: aldo/keto reductase [Cytophagaceae bacterium]|nr:aldo/keto reductase [Cytophagaceae bacterium]MDW8455472.1 aldo/keto reductase [Cytophagaceae bacterium]